MIIQRLPNSICDGQFPFAAAGRSATFISTQGMTSCLMTHRQQRAALPLMKICWLLALTLLASSLLALYQGDISLGATLSAGAAAQQEPFREAQPFQGMEFRVQEFKPKFDTQKQHAIPMPAILTAVDFNVITRGRLSAKEWIFR